MLGFVVCGLRTWMCTMAAPALAASIAELAICSGVTGTAGLRPGVSAEPVTAQEIITLRCMVSHPAVPKLSSSACAGGIALGRRGEVITAPDGNVCQNANDHE